ncbi:50S ribosomal protein L4 [Candidatus Uhrbacteria bacterium]|nr:50S ribosomal protein L4 [Candidatus Uhrbacteria bacterium]
MKTKLYNLEGIVTGEVELPASVFSVSPKPALIHETVLALQANRRHPIAHTKTRGEVRGGGKKPWRQKGTGRARHGSIRSPLWVGGGVVGGPRSTRNFSVKINRKVRQKALCMALTDKAQDERLLVLEALTLPEAKTRQLAALLKKFPRQKNALVVLPASDALILRASRNLPAVKTVTANALSLLDVLKYQTILMPQETLPALEKLYGRTKSLFQNSISAAKPRNSAAARP